MDICVIGSGHVGLVTGACFAEHGHKVVCVDNDPKKLAILNKGKSWFYEQGLEPLVAKHLKNKRLRFTPSIEDGVKHSTVIFIAVGTPPLPSGDADLTIVEKVCQLIAKSMDGYRLIVEKSTVPVETGKWIKQTFKTFVRKGVPFDVASNPEFLREGTGVYDFFHPDRIVIGVETKKAETLLRSLYKGFKAPVVVTDIESAELIKHASNSFLAMKISYINAVASICERVGADVKKVALGMGMDRRIGPAFLSAGAGYGGFCLPKDVEAFIRIAEKLGYDFDLLKAVKRINEDQKNQIVQKMEKQLWNLKGKRIGVLGLAFKPDTDDLRFAPAIDVIQALHQAGAEVRAYDPKAMEEAKGMLNGTVFAKDPYQLAKDCDGLVLMTEWKEFRNLDFGKLKKLMRQPVIVDGRNLYEPETVRKKGFRYVGVGRGQ